MKALILKQWQDAITTGVISCNCGQPRALAVAYRCLYCGVYFCPVCAEEHFGQTIQAWVEAKRVALRDKLENKK